MSIKITWHGHSTFTLDINGTKVVVDPFFAGNNPAAKTKAADVEAQFILQTHGHPDHSTDLVAVAGRNNALVIANFEICNWLGSQGHENCHGMNSGGAYTFPFGRVKMTHALHSSSLPDGSYGGNPGGFVVTTDNKNIYIAGDTALFSDMTLIGQMGLDLAIVPVGDNFTMGPDDALLALEYLKPKVVMPCHYNTWPVISIDIDAWVDRVKSETAVQPVKLEVDESYSL